MRRNDRQLGKPEFVYKDTQANINLITGANYDGQVAYATDTGLLGHCVGNSWVWEREVLNADRTYYVATGGNDSNDGLTSGTSFLTIQKAMDTVCKLDVSTFVVTIQIADGTYTSGLSLTRSWLGSGYVQIQGNLTNPENVVVSTTGSAFQLYGIVPNYLMIKNFDLIILAWPRIKTTTSGHGISASKGLWARFQNIRFDVCADYHILSSQYAIIECTGDYAIVGNAKYHMVCDGGNINIGTKTITVSAGLTFTGAFAYSTRIGIIAAVSNTYSSLSATGARYVATINGIIQTGGGANYFPGNSAGSTATGGQYA